MGRMDKTVFVSYRHPNLIRALAISQKLSAQGFDVFFDHGNSSREDTTNLDQIKKRPHFLILLTPNALDSCDDPNDPIRREIETAIENKRNIISLSYDDASFNHPSLKRHLIGKILELGNHPLVNIDNENFHVVVNTLCSYLNGPTTRVVEHSAVAQNPKTEFAQKNDTQEETGLAAQEWFERGDKTSDLDEKIRCYTEAIRLQPDYVEVYSFRALALQAKGDNEGALRDFTHCIESRPRSAVGYNNRGEFLSSIGDVENAIRDYDDAIRLQPDFAIAYNNRGEARQSRNNLVGAIQDFNRAIELDPTFAHFYANRGSALRSIGETSAALTDCNTAIHIQPDLAGAYTNRGGVFLDMRDFNKAIDDFSMAIHLEGNVAPQYYNRGLAYHQRGIEYKQKSDLTQAVTDYNEALRLQPGHFGAFINRAALRTLFGDLDGAISDYNEILQTYPRYGRAYRDRAYAHIAKQNLPPAISDLQTYLDLGNIQKNEQEEIKKLLATLKSKV